MRKALWIIIPSFLFVTLLSTLWHFSEKKMALFLRDQIQEQVKLKTNWDLKIETVQLFLVPPKVDISTITLTPPSGITWITPVTMESVSGSLDILNLLAGQIKFSNIQIKGPHTEITLSDIPPSPKPLEVLPIKEIFDALQVIQIKMLLIDKTNIQVKQNKKTEPLHVTGGLLFQTTPQTIHYSLKAQIEAKQKKQKRIDQSSNPQIEANNEKVAENLQTLQIQSKGSLTSKSLRVTGLELEASQSKIELQGEFLQFANVITRPQFSGLVDLSLDGHTLMNWLSLLELPTASLKLEGHLRSSGKIEIEKWKQPSFDLKTTVKDAKLNEHSIGSIQSQLRFNKSKINTDELILIHPAGELALKGLKWDLEQDTIESKVDLKTLDLQKLFIDIGLKQIPVDLWVSSLLQCKGHLQEFKIDCQGKVEGSNLDVRTGMKSSSIVSLNQFSGEGTVSVDTQEVRYDSSVVLPLSRGHSKGTIHFHTGFIIDFESKDFDFQDIPSISGLDFEGKAQLQGRTQGTSAAATLAISLGAENFWFENFGLGSVNGKVSYEKGHLKIDVPDGQLGNSQYLAQLDVNLSQSTIKGVVESPHLEAKDAIAALHKRVPIPVEISGVGKTRARFEGPFHLGDLSYSFEGILQKGSIQGELYDEVKWSWLADKGSVSITNNTLQKGQALISVNGTSTPTGHLNLVVRGNNFKLEESSLLSKYAPSLGGNLNFQMNVKNHILKPDIQLEGRIENTTLGDSDLPDSNIGFHTDGSGLKVDLELLGKQIQFNMHLPYNKQDQAHLVFEVQRFNFTDFLSSALGSPLQSEYDSLLSVKMDLTSKNNNLFQGTGSLIVDDLFLSRNEYFLKNEKPMMIEFQNGFASLRHFSLRGPKGQVRVEGEKFSSNQLKININGFLDVQLLQLFAPFIDNMSGPVNGQVKITGSLQSPEIYGNLDINEIAFRIKGFPALFDHISAHLEFSQKRILIESVRGAMAGGSLTGNGSITINGARDMPIDIKAQLRNIQLEVPEDIESSGSADITLSGHWFPYSLSGTYRVNQAFIDKDFSADSGENQLRQSIYLPKELTKSSFDPVLLDLQVYLDKRVEIKNPQIAGLLSGQLQVKGPPQAPLLFGSIKTLPQAQLFFRDKIFDIQSGLIKFNDPNELNPELFFTARSYIENYEINLLLQGKAKALQFSLTSQPPLEEQDIISLLALGVTNQKLATQIQSNQQATQMGNQLGAAIISANPLNKEIKQSLGVDVKFSSNYDDTKNETINKVTASKELIPKKLNATASLSENQRDVRFQYLINDRLSSVLTYETTENQSGTNSSTQPSTSIFGLDLEYKVEFK